MKENFVINSDTKWEEDLSDDSEIKLEVTIYRKREWVEMLHIEIAIKIDGDLHSLKTILHVGDLGEVEVINTKNNSLAMLFNKLYEYIDRLNKQE